MSTIYGKNEGWMVSDQKSGFLFKYEFKEHMSAFAFYFQSDTAIGRKGHF